jgi:hypothetical protein
LTAIDGFLGAIYGVLETVAGYHRIVDQQIPEGFRRQMKHFPDLALEKNPWLAHFYDLRSELSHYSSGILGKEGDRIRVQFRRAKENYFYKDKGVTHVIELSLIEGFKDGLEEMLDRWARSHLALLDQNGLFELWVVDHAGVPRLRQQELSDILALAGL